jgi:hypothetical protein
MAFAEPEMYNARLMIPSSAKRPVYDRRLANRISLWVVIVVAIALAAYMAVELSIDPISVSDSKLRVLSLFGFSLPLSDIRDIQFVAESAPVGSRISGNGAFGLFREGSYNVDGLGAAKVFLKKPDLSYVLIKTDDSNYVLSLGSKDKDQLLYDRIKMGIK